MTDYTPEALEALAATCRMKHRAEAANTPYGVMPSGEFAKIATALTTIADKLRTGQLILAQPSGDGPEAAARIQALETSLAEALRERTEARAEAANLRADLRQTEGRAKEARRQALEEAAKVAESYIYAPAIQDGIRAIADPLLDRQGDGKEGV